MGNTTKRQQQSNPSITAHQAPEPEKERIYFEPTNVPLEKPMLPDYNEMSAPNFVVARFLRPLLPGKFGKKISQNTNNNLSTATLIVDAGSSKLQLCQSTTTTTAWPIKNPAPIVDGIVTNWDMVMEYMGKNSALLSSSNTMLIMEPAFVNAATIIQRETWAEVAFEQYGMEYLSMQNQAKLALFASNGAMSGVVLHSGLYSTNLVPIRHGHVVEEAITSAPFGGKIVSDYCSHLMTQRGYSFATSYEKQILDDIKHSLHYVALDFASTMEQALSASHLSKSYELPDGNVITLGTEKFETPEIMFNSKYLSKTLPQFIWDARNTHAESVADLYATRICMSGGNLNFEGMFDRLKKELQFLGNETCKLLPSSTSPGNLSMIGANLMRELAEFKQAFAIHKNDYFEMGRYAVHACCVPWSRVRNKKDYEVENTSQVLLQAQTKQEMLNRKCIVMKEFCDIAVICNM